MRNMKIWIVSGLRNANTHLRIVYSECPVKNFEEFEHLQVDVTEALIKSLAVT